MDYFEMREEISKKWEENAELLFKNGNYDRAIECITEAIRLESETSDLWYKKAKYLEAFGIYEEKNDIGKSKTTFEEAIFAIEKALEYFQSSTFVILYEEKIKKKEIWYRKGALLWRIENLDDSIKCFDEATKLDSKDSQLWNHKGILLDSLGRSFEANQAFDNSIKLNQKNGIVWWNKALVLKNLKRFSEAITSIEKAIILGIKGEKLHTFKKLKKQ